MSNSPYTPNGVRELYEERDEDCGHDGCDEDAVWQVNFIVGSSGTAFDFYCDDHVEDYFGYHPVEDGVLSDTETAQDGGRDE